MFFKHTPGELLESPPPRPVYARIDQFEPVDDPEFGPFMVLLDCVEAAWLDEISESAGHLSDKELDEADNKISIIAIPSKHLKDFKGDDDDYLSGKWYYLELGNPDGHGPPVVDQFHNLFQGPTERRLINAKQVTTEQAAILKRLAGWNGIKESPPSDLEEALTINHPIDAVAIYDVGQGAATALLSDEIPVLYFDVGGSAIGNWRSFPEPLKRFCTTHEPPIVLSHWDWDHWSSARRDDQLLDCQWILPIQDQAGDLGAVHARFLAMLKARSRGIYWWGYETPPIKDKNGVHIFRARGTVKNRNESGLVVLIHRNGDWVLLPADASLESLCRPLVTFPFPIDYLMVPHHGGSTALNGIPRPTNKSTSHLVYSYGVANMYQHPLPKTVHAFRRSWKQNAHTALRGCNGLGHIGIDLTGKRRPSSGSSGSPCGFGGCQLEIQKWL